MIKIGSRFVRNSHELRHLEHECRRFAREHQKKLHESQLKNLETFLTPREQIYEFETIADLVVFLSDRNRKINPRRLYEEEIEKMQAARHRKNIHRLGRIFEKAKKQIAHRVPGINNLPPEELLPLDHHYRDQHQRWMKNGKGVYVHLKPIGEQNETDVSAFGDPEDPAMNYWKNEDKRNVNRDFRELGRHLGHRYKTVKQENHLEESFEKKGFQPNIYSYNHAKNRHYGAKKGASRSGEYKVKEKMLEHYNRRYGDKAYKNVVDGHSQQVRTDPVTLDPYERLRYPTADRHPYSMYWEYESFGEYLRQDYFEQYALDSVRPKKNTKSKKKPVVQQVPTSLLQVNDFGDYDNPRLMKTHDGKVLSGGAPQNAIVAERFHIKMKRGGRVRYWQCPNSPDPRYGTLGINTGEKGKSEKAAPEFEIDDVRQFPSAQVIYPEELDNENFAGSKEDVRRYREYKTPPGTPNYLSPIRAVRSPHDHRVHFEGEELTTDEDTDSEIQCSFISSMTQSDQEVMSLVNEKNIEWESKSEHPVGRRRDRYSSDEEHSESQSSDEKSLPNRNRNRIHNSVPAQTQSQGSAIVRRSPQREDSSPPPTRAQSRGPIPIPVRRSPQREDSSPPPTRAQSRVPIPIPVRRPPQREDSSPPPTRAQSRVPIPIPVRRPPQREDSFPPPTRVQSRVPIPIPVRRPPQREDSSPPPTRAQSRVPIPIPVRRPPQREDSSPPPTREQSRGVIGKTSSRRELKYSSSEENSDNSQNDNFSSDDESNNHLISSVKNDYNKSKYQAHNNPAGMYYHPKEVATRTHQKFKNNDSSLELKKSHRK